MLPAKERTVIRPMLRGVISLSDRERAQRIIEDGRRWFASIEEPASDGELLVRATDDDFRELGLTGFGSAAVARLRDLAGGSDARSTMAREALALLLRLAGGEGTDEGGGAEGTKRTEESATRTEEGAKRTEEGAQRTEDAGHGLADGAHPDGTHPDGAHPDGAHPDGTHPDVAYPWRDSTPSHSAATTNHDTQGAASGRADPRGDPA